MSIPKTLNLKGGQHGVLLFHGLSSSPLELQFIARGLHRAGYTVRVPVMSGYTHGTFDRPIDANQWVLSALKELTLFLSEMETVSIGGLCLGSVLSLRLAALRSDRIQNVLALSTAFHYDGWGNPWHTPLLPLARYTPFARRIAVKERSPFGLKDERMRAWIAKQMREAGDSDAGAASLRVRDILHARDLIAMTRKSLGEITCDTLLIHAKEDENATPRSSFEVAERVQAKRVRCILLQDSYHMISIDREKDLVLSEMLQFLSPQDVLKKSAPPTERVNVLNLFDPRLGASK